MDLNRRIAEKLEPEPKWDRLSVYSEKGLWTYEIFSKVSPPLKPCYFESDGNAMLSLISAMQNKGFFMHFIAYMDGGGKSCFNLQAVEPEAWDDSWFEDFEKLYGVIQQAAAKALGLEVDDE